MKSVHKCVIAFIVVIVGCGCDSGEVLVLDEMDRKKAVEIRDLIESELQPGSSSEEIVGFFDKHNIDFTYDRFSERYQAIIRDVSGSDRVDQAIVIYIYVDENKYFLSFEVNDSFTAI